MEWTASLQFAAHFQTARSLPTDESPLLAACRDGDERAFAELVRRYRARAVNLAF